jgi:hypothetical protein
VARLRRPNIIDVKLKNLDLAIKKVKVLKSCSVQAGCAMDGAGRLAGELGQVTLQDRTQRTHREPTVRT